MKRSKKIERYHGKRAGLEIAARFIEQNWRTTPGRDLLASEIRELKNYIKRPKA